MNELIGADSSSSGNIVGISGNDRCFSKAGLDAPTGPDSSSDVAEELKSLEQDRRTLRSQEAAAVQGQIAGIRAGASAEAYADVFADIAAQRRDLEQRHAVLTRMLQTTDDCNIAPSTRSTDRYLKTFEKTRKVLTSAVVLGATKRSAIGIIVEKVVCHKQGADIQFIPGIFGETEDRESSRSTFTPLASA